MAVGQAHVVVLSRSGEVYCWGQGTSQQLGIGVAVDCHYPRLILHGKGVSEIGPDALIPSGHTRCRRTPAFHDQDRSSD